ncbi:MAG TPA: zinc ribbon domain-containing protein [Paenibacillus sp.]|uniref:zinc ribbon domain-containing protein n=1 Tax=Paenibacillus sp. TaxID=58172 RepID=UPI002BABDC6F|nr:zinc ribbon domain-containing protein [Paenibacillus sp.]HUC93475.1 zinc ribbon domain-containing protein [Paenibacillus sp.]
MIECPWCYKEVTIRNGRCPNCKHELYENTEQSLLEEDDNSFVDAANDGFSIEDTIIDRYKCSKCKGNSCKVSEVAMTGTGLSKMFDIQHHHYLFVSCNDCGYVEVYDPDVLKGKSTGGLGTVMDILFGG